MKTIEDRAERLSKEFSCAKDVEKAVFQSCLVMGYEQRAIDNAELERLKAAWEKEARVNHDAEAHYKQGFHDAVEKACEWWDTHYLDVITALSDGGWYDLLDNFKKAMEE